MATVRYGIPTLPVARRLYSARPAHAADATRLADACNHLAGYRFARLPPAIVEPRADTVAYGLPAGPQASDVVRFVHRVSPQHDYLFVTLDYQMDDEGTGGPSITVEVNTLGGVAVDVGVAWTLATGVVGASAWQPLGITSTTVYPIQTLMTPPRLPVAGEATAGAPSTNARLLDVSTVAAAGGGLVEVVVTVAQARIVSGSVWDWPTGEV